MRSAEEHRKLADEIAAPFENSTFALRQEAAEALREIAAAQDRTAADLREAVAAICLAAYEADDLADVANWLEWARKIVADKVGDAVTAEARTDALRRADAILSLVAPLLERAREEGYASGGFVSAPAKPYLVGEGCTSTTPTRYYTEAEMQAAVAAEREACAAIAKTAWLDHDYADLADADAMCRLCEDIAEDRIRSRAASLVSDHDRASSEMEKNG